MQTANDQQEDNKSNDNISLRLIITFFFLHEGARYRCAHGFLINGNFSYRSGHSYGYQAHFSLSLRLVLATKHIVSFLFFFYPPNYNGL